MNYDYQITDSGCIVRDSMGNIIIMTDTEEEAMDYMSDYVNTPKERTVSISPYEQFDNYTKSLKGKMYIDGKIGCCFEKPLQRFAKSFEKYTGYKVEICPRYMGGEYIYFVEDVH